MDYFVVGIHFRDSSDRLDLYSGFIEQVNLIQSTSGNSLDLVQYVRLRYIYGGVLTLNLVFEPWYRGGGVTFSSLFLCGGCSSQILLQVMCEWQFPTKTSLETVVRPCRRKVV